VVVGPRAMLEWRSGPGGSVASAVSGGGGHTLVVAPTEADETVRAYLASTPRV
jgi:hypothetical protein